MKALKLLGTSCLAMSMAVTPVFSQISAVGDGEGEVSIVAWAGYVERGETDKSFDWVTKFEVRPEVSR
jgi:putative spermidine/putrescine transport system substrate-binding protein